MKLKYWIKFLGFFLTLFLAIYIGVVFCSKPIKENNKIIKNSKKNKIILSQINSQYNQVDSNNKFKKIKLTKINSKKLKSGLIREEYKQKILERTIEPYGNLHVVKNNEGKIIHQSSSLLYKNYKIVGQLDHLPKDSVFWVTEYGEPSVLEPAMLFYESGFKIIKRLSDNKVLFKKKIEIY